jgi:hypothetical protein
MADQIGRAVYGVDLGELGSSKKRIESRWGHECLFVVIVVFCQVEISASG